jgi:hypothetical protein
MLFVVDPVQPVALVAVVGVRCHAELHRRVVRHCRRVSAGRTTLDVIPVACATSWCRLRMKPSPPAQFRVARRQLQPHAAAGRRPPPRAARTRPQPPD